MYQQNFLLNAIFFIKVGLVKRRQLKEYFYCSEIKFNNIITEC